MTRAEAAMFARQRLDEFGLTDWHVRINPNMKEYGLCSYHDKCIILNGLHIDTHPDVEIHDTVNHEIAHALTPGHKHDFTWKNKAVELGALPQECGSMALSQEAIDAIRSGATIEIEFEEHKVQRVEKIIHEEIRRVPKYNITRLQDRCPTCGKVAVTKNEIVVPEKDDNKPDRKLIFLECGHVITKNIPKATPFHKLLADGDISCQHEWIKHPKTGKETNHCGKCGGFRPFNFQIEGMKFAEQALATGSGVLIADGMGLGKTPQSIGTLVYHLDEWAPVLFIVKSAVKYQWFRQLMRWSRDKIIAQVINSSTDYLIPNMKAYIIGFDMLVPKTKQRKGKTITQGFNIEQFDRIGIKTVVIDECQHISNPDSTRTQQVRRVVKDRKVIALSGTPWNNRATEFYPVLNMIAPMKFPSAQGFKDTWVQTYWDGKYLKVGGIKNIPKFKEYTKDIVIRREKQEVLDEYNPVNRMPLYVQLDQFYQDMYDESEGDFVKWYNDKVIGGEPLDGINILAQMSRMRHATGLAKIPATVEFIKDFIEQKEGSFILGVHHHDVGMLLVEKLREELPSDIQVIAFKSGDNSTEFTDQFSKQRSVAVMSTLAGGEGVDGLQHSASDLALHERQWNPGKEEQFEGRLDRMGQKQGVVDATYIMATDTIDTFFDEIVERKRTWFHESMNKGEKPVWNQGDLAKELASRIIANYNKKNKKPQTEAAQILANSAMNQ